MVEIGRQRPAGQPHTHPLTRTCVGCRGRDDRSALLRVVAQAHEGGRMVAVVDVRLRLPGRGAWLHPAAECLEAAVRRRAFARALRCGAELDLAPVRGRLADLARRPGATPTGQRKSTPAPPMSSTDAPPGSNTQNEAVQRDEHPMSTQQ